MNISEYKGWSGVSVALGFVFIAGMFVLYFYGSRVLVGTEDAPFAGTYVAVSSGSRVLFTLDNNGSFFFADEGSYCIVEGTFNYVLPTRIVGSIYKLPWKKYGGVFSYRRWVDGPNVYYLTLNPSSWSRFCDDGWAEQRSGEILIDKDDLDLHGVIKKPLIRVGGNGAM